MVKSDARMDATALGFPQGAVKLVVNRTFLQVESERKPMDDFDAHAGIFKLRAYSDSCVFETSEGQETAVQKSHSDGCVFETTKEPEIAVQSPCCEFLSSPESDIVDDAKNEPVEEFGSPRIQAVNQHQQGQWPTREQGQVATSSQLPYPCAWSCSVPSPAGHSTAPEGEDLELMCARAEVKLALARTKVATERASLQIHMNENAITALPHVMGLVPVFPGYLCTSGMWSTCATPTAQHSASFACADELPQALGQSSGRNVKQRNVTATSAASTDEGMLTTIMLRNLPNDYSRDMALKFLDSQGFKDRYDFFYLPFDFKRRSGLGYAFINFVSPEDAQRAKTQLPGFRNWIIASSKILDVQYTKPTQGLSANIARFKNSPVMHPDVPEQFKPLMFQQGCRVPFPPSTRHIMPPVESSYVCKPDTSKMADHLQ
jgi:hypothetical protein